MKKINKALFASFMALLLGTTGCGTHSTQTEVDPLLAKYNTIQKILIDTANAAQIPQKNDFSKNKMSPSIKIEKAEESNEGEVPSFWGIEFEEGESSPELKSFVYPVAGATAVIESLLQHGYGNLDITNKICFIENDSHMSTLRVSYLEEYKNLVMVDYYLDLSDGINLTFVICNEPNNEYVLLGSPLEWDKGNFGFDYEKLNKGYSGFGDFRDVSIEEKFDTILASNELEEQGYSMDPIKFWKKVYDNDGGIIPFDSLTYDENNENHILLNNLPKFGYLGWETLNDSYFALHRDIPEGYFNFAYEVNDGVYIETGSIAYQDEPYSGVALNRIPDDVTRIEQCGFYYALEIPATCEYINLDCLSKCEYLFVRGNEVNENLKSMLEESSLNIHILCQDEYLDVYGMLTPSAPHSQQVENNELYGHIHDKKH